MTTIKINGRTKHYERLTGITRISRSTWTVQHLGTRETYRIEGGIRAGGTRRDWFLDGGTFNGSIHCTSLVDALNLLETM